MPINVLIRETLSAPSDSHARAISAISVTLGESFTIIVLWYTSRTALTILEAPLTLVPKAIPPFFTLGQLILTSIAGIPSSASNFSAHAA